MPALSLCLVKFSCIKKQQLGEFMRRTEVYQVRLDMQEKKQAFAVFKQLGISPAQAIRLFFRQVVVTRSIPFAIENAAIEPTETSNKTSKKTTQTQPSQPSQPTQLSHLSDQDVFDQLNQLLGENQQAKDDISQ